MRLHVEPRLPGRLQLGPIVVGPRPRGVQHVRRHREGDDMPADTLILCRAGTVRALVVAALLLGGAAGMVFGVLVARFFC